ncbi:DUF3040 domain-containing protein [Streptomyces silvisoli]|uniref:DUF3040 domain-containing protein n=1 Tax=Streptomyces silvisoli TaxID=3034235 RepID=A0ABT5ZFY6_9ACTN|nr:DUF3040 domain-containing protein [Streptomyces silvisoli]MDF3288739.1 DUF3040 domain-containing protein [Streptomyces silvisoli]
MDGHRLSDEERRALEQIETMLRQDDGLDRRLRTMRLRRLPNATGWLRRWRPLLVVLVTVASTALMVMAVASLAPAVIAAVAATWLLTVVLTVDMVRDRRRGRRDRPPQN